jgi:PTS system nitrogen regulatory IIA component
VAIPHGKSKEVKKILAAFGRSRAGMDFQSLDGKPTHIFFLLIAPEDSAGMHLKALAQISRLMKDQPFRKRLMEARSGEEIQAIFSEGEEKT